MLKRMNWLLGGILFMVTQREFVDGTSPSFEDIPIIFSNNDDFVTATSEVIGSHTNISDGFINTFMDLKIFSKCGSQFCSNVHFQKPENCESCENLVDVSNVDCTYVSVVEEGFFAGGFTNIEAPHSDPIILNVAKKATKYLYGFFDTSNPCPLHLVEVIRAKQQAVMGFNYELEIQVETNGADFDCEHIIKNCENVRVHEPIAEFCPHEEPSCVVPVRLQDVDCIELFLFSFFNETPIVGGFSVREIDEEIISIGKGVMDQIPNSFGLKNHCYLNFENVHRAQSQVVAGTNFIMDIEFSTHGIHCPTEHKICYNVKIFRPLPYQCQEDKCLSLTQSEDINCVPIDKKEATCQVHVNDAQILKNVNDVYHMEFQLETRKSEEGCKSIKKNCKNVRYQNNLMK
ncbi:unnamed protein product [Lepeophtheirus salmonis]|uniref:(salmon louse) hypothetical protein n=1 Tax=Lepeophtheirus salmonis TaxID=72036 RepID=A0A7R8H4R1_LEPSM|nr:unnamed protein product [Lepeophtheirus salmonis]CAF2852660.1 unnamed protein product [Lepeophtheirus salmonis]